MEQFDLEAAVRASASESGACGQEATHLRREDGRDGCLKLRMVFDRGPKELVQGPLAFDDCL